MKPIIAILPNKEISNQIMLVRQELVKLGRVGEAKRSDVIPHASLYYFENIENPDTIVEINKSLREATIKSELINMQVVRIRTWSNKAALMLDNEPVRSLYTELADILKIYPTENEDVLRNLNVKEQAIGEKTYSKFEEITADHIKVVRNIKDESLDVVIDYVDKNLPKTITFDRVVLTGEDCTEKDILWEMKLSKSW